MNGLGILLVCLFSFGAILFRPHIAALSLLGASLFITQAQSIDFGLNLYALRFVELAAFVRVLGKGELFKLSFTKIDRWLLVFFGTMIASNSLQIGTVDLYQFGTAVDCWLVYFSFRALISTTSEYGRFMVGAVYMLGCFGALMSFEALSGKNLFASMGGVPESPILRDGHYRCQGSFRVPITAGSLGATYFHLFVGFMFDKRCRRWAIAGAGACLAIVIASRSSGPLMALLTGAIGWGCWLIRGKMQWVRRGIVAVLIGLHLTMSKPVWFIFDRLSGILGGDGWHRSNLIDKFFLHIGEWWLIGMPFINTSNWAATQLPWGGVDVTNYYVSIGLIGGLLTLAVFIKFLVVCFTALGKAAALLRQDDADRTKEALVWGIGCTIAAHAVNLTAVLYWDQSYVFWYLHVALAATMVSQIARELQPLPAEQTKKTSFRAFHPVDARAGR